MTLAYFDDLFYTDMGMDSPYTSEEIEASKKAWDMMEMAESGMFNVSDDNEDGKITADEVAPYADGAYGFWSSELTGESGSLSIPCAYNFLNNFAPTVEKNRPVMNAMPVRCVMDIK